MFGFGKRQHNHSTATDGYDPILGELGSAIVIQPISYRCPGRVRYRGSSWPAECCQHHVTLQPGMRVRVIRRQCVLCLVVELEPD